MVSRETRFAGWKPPRRPILTRPQLIPEHPHQALRRRTKPRSFVPHRHVHSSNRCRVQRHRMRMHTRVVIRPARVRERMRMGWVRMLMMCVLLVRVMMVQHMLLLHSRWMLR